MLARNDIVRNKIIGVWETERVAVPDSEHVWTWTIPYIEISNGILFRLESIIDINSPASIERCFIEKDKLNRGNIPGGKSLPIGEIINEVIVSGSFLSFGLLLENGLVLYYDFNFSYYSYGLTPLHDFEEGDILTYWGQKTVKIQE